MSSKDSSSILNKTTLTYLLVGIAVLGAFFGDSFLKSSAKADNLITRREFTDTIKALTEGAKETGREAKAERDQIRIQLTEIAKDIGRLQGAQGK